MCCKTSFTDFEKVKMMMVIRGINRRGPILSEKNFKLPHNTTMESKLTRSAHPTRIMVKVFKNRFCSGEESLVFGRATLNSRYNR